MMRRIHRWTMTVFVILLLYWVGSGLLLNLYDATDANAVFAREGGGAGAAAPRNVQGIDVERTAPLTEAELEPMALAAVQAVQAAAPGAAITSLELHHAGDGMRITVGVDGKPPRRFVIDGTSGAIIEPQPAGATGSPPAPSLHGPIKRWHRGLMLGVTGATLSFASGCALLLLWVTGIVLYGSLWNARRRIGRPAWFWR